MNILEASQAMQQGELNSVSLVRTCLERIAALDKTGPQLNSIIELNPEAEALAAALDEERLSGHVRGPLHGIPIVLKDNIDTADRLTTTAGSLALQGSIASQDAFLVQALRRVGLVILAKANLSEWANFRSNHSVSGWSSRGGQTKNPYALDRSPCGSSSGSAVAVAAELCLGAVGTETDGSIICPSHTNGIVGLKPTLGLVSRSGIIPIAHSQDTAGPMCRSVMDAALLLGAMTGVDPRDPVTAGSAGKFPADYSLSLQPGDLKGVRIGVARNFFGSHPAADRVIESCLPVLKDLGAQLVDPTNIETADKLGEPEMEVLYYEFKADLDAYLGALGAGARVHSMQDVIRFNEANQEQVMPYFGQERMLKALEKGSLQDEAYLRARETCLSLSRQAGIDAALQKDSLHALLAPTGQPAWLVDYVNGDCGEGSCTSPAAVAGYPHITVPAGFVHGLPVGISFFSTAYTEPLLLRIAYLFEQATLHRQPPQFLPTARF